jgi:hypothetical protein
MQEGRGRQAEVSFPSPLVERPTLQFVAQINVLPSPPGVTAQAATPMGVATLFALDTTCTGVSTEHILNSGNHVKGL